ncbi:cytochrome P450 [Mycena sp. CBHHK59/15]|nr:cytochrome P450 [Mycena sp. CBHHK59/15]
MTALTNATISAHNMTVMTFLAGTYPAALFFVGFAGLGCHLIFNRFEPKSLPTLATLLVLPPLVLSPLLDPHAQAKLTAISISLLTYIATLAVSVVIYRLSPFHPLASYPGPILCKISKLRWAWIAMGGKQHLYYQELHRKYGSVVRIGNTESFDELFDSHCLPGPNELSFCDSKAISPMMGTHGMPKGPWWDGRMPENKTVRSILSLRNPEEHSRRRRIWNRAFSASALKEYDVVVKNRLVQFVEIINDNAGQSIDLTQWMGWFMYDVMNDIVFGGGVELMRDGDKDGLYTMFEEFLPMALLMSHVPWIGELTTWLPGFAKDVKTFRSYAVKCAIARKMHGSPRKDLFYHLIDEAGLEREPPSLAQVVSDSSPAIVAGAETTSTAICNLFWLLLCNPIAYSRLQVEIDSLGANALDSESQKHLTYLNACINETLRLFPAVLSGSQRAPLIGSGGKLIGPYFIPEGTSAVVPSYSLQRDPRYFSPSPDAFLPERWLSVNDLSALKPAVFKSTDDFIHDLSAFIPFSYGPGNCVGKHLAYQEMRMIVCTLLTKFQMRFEDGFCAQSWGNNLRDYYILKKGRLPVVFLPRSR